MHPMCLLILAVKQMVVMNTPKAQEMSMLILLGLVRCQI